MYIFSRDELVSERLQAADLQAKLSGGVQEKLKVEGESERLKLDIKHLSEKLKWYQEQLSSTKEALSSSQKPDVHAAYMESRFSPVEKAKHESSDEVMRFSLDVLW